MNTILRYTGAGEPNAERLKKVLADNKIRIVDASGLPGMVLVEGWRHEHLSCINEAQQGWQAFPQKSTIKVPDTRRKISR
jgi:hypothetical protein